MKKIWFFILAASFSVRISAQDIYMTSNASVSFFSETPIENIDAYTTQAVGAVNVKTKDIFLKVPMKTFTFKKALMQEHFNENYMETDKEGPKDEKGNVTYPNRYATFKGKINEAVDLTKEGTYNVTVTGTLYIHGVDQPRTINAVIMVKGEKIDIASDFDVKVADHKIKIPTVVTEHIAETVAVKVHALLEPAKD